jgi:hypothetical protein
MCFGVNILAVGVKINCLLAIADASAKLKTLAQPARKYQATDMPEIIESAQVALRSEVVRWTSQVTGTRSGAHMRLVVPDTDAYSSDQVVYLRLPAMMLTSAHSAFIKSPCQSTHASIIGLHHLIVQCTCGSPVHNNCISMLQRGPNI